MGFGEHLYNIKWLITGLVEKPIAAVKKAASDKTVRIVAIGFVSLSILVPVLTVLIVSGSSANKNKVKTPPIIFDTIREDELFIPDEPNFLPDVILEKEQKKTWSKQDSEKFWTSPKTEENEIWKNKITEKLDKLLDGVP